MEPATPLWHHLSPRMRGWVAGHVVLVIAGGLAMDHAWGWTGQYVATVWAWGVWCWLFAIGGTSERRAIVWCTLLAGTGEAVLSLAWGVYDYQFGNVPWFVPPGHALLMTLGLLVRPWVTPRVVAAVMAMAGTWAAACVWRGSDQFGAALAVLFLGCAALSRGRDLYAAMLVLALLMELYGTALGNWTWRPLVPGTGWTAANPPFAAGAFYCLLDLLVLALVSARGRALVRRSSFAEDSHHASLAYSPRGGHQHARAVGGDLLHSPGDVAGANVQRLAAGPVASAG
jgi:hypothetical protein